MTDASASNVDGEETRVAWPLFHTAGHNKSNKKKRGRKNGSNNYYCGLFRVFATLILVGSIVQVVYFHHRLPNVLLMEKHFEWKLGNSKKKELTTNKQQPSPVLQQKTSNATATNITTTKDENPLLSLFRRAKVEEALSPEDLKRLPDILNGLQQLYGPLDQGPVIVGLETCETYRDTVPLERRYTAVAGLFNTGTNAMEFHLGKNVGLPHKWQIPWGKHRVAAVRLVHTAPGMQTAVQQDVLPVVMVRDPLHWMQSMCKSPYATKWKHTRLHCPNLVPTDHDRQRFGSSSSSNNNSSYFNVTIQFDKQDIRHWDSLAHLYSDWYNQYVQADYPRLLVRFEDMLLQPEAVVQAIAECAGAPPLYAANKKFQYQINAAKNHGSHTNFVKAVWKSANATARLKSLTPQDLAYAREHLDGSFLDLMHYRLPPPSR